jgi:hypothetical protein
VGLLFSSLDSEIRVRGDHPLRVICEIENAAPSDPSKAFTALCTDL